MKRVRWKMHKHSAQHVIAFRSPAAPLSVDRKIPLASTVPGFPEGTAAAQQQRHREKQLLSHSLTQSRSSSACGRQHHVLRVSISVKNGDVLHKAQDVWTLRKRCSNSMHYCKDEARKETRLTCSLRGAKGLHVYSP